MAIESTPLSAAPRPPFPPPAGLVMHKLSPRCARRLPSTEVIAQFMLDAPRTQLYVGNERVRCANLALAMLLNRSERIGDGIRLAHWCTQTALAPFYLERVASLNRNRTTSAFVHHLVDNGPQHNIIDRDARSPVLLEIYKPFIVMSAEDCDTAAEATGETEELRVEVYHRGYRHRWIRTNHNKGGGGGGGGGAAATDDDDWQIVPGLEGVNARA